MKKILRTLGCTVLVGAMILGVTGCGPTEEAHQHTLEKHSAVAATCTAGGVEEYYECTDETCGKLFSDIGATEELYAPTPTPKADHTLVPTAAKDSTCQQAGHEAYNTCSVCRKLFDGAGTAEIAAPTAKELAAHDLAKVDGKAATETFAGYSEYYTCSTCKTMFSDANGTNAAKVSDLYLAPTNGVSWTAMNDVAASAVAPVTENGVTTFTGLNSSSYIENVFVDEAGKSIAGAYDASFANTEYTYSMNISATGMFALVMFTDASAVKTTYDADDITNKVADKLGLYIRFDPNDGGEVKLQAAVGNTSAETGIKAKGSSSFNFDGTTENTVQIVAERYEADKIILHVWVNGEKVNFKKTSAKGADACGFTLRTAWDRTDLVSGAGESYSKTSDSYSTVCISRGMSATEGLGSAFGVAVIGRLEESNTVATGKVGDTQEDVVVKISNVLAVKTGAQVVAAA